MISSLAVLIWKAFFFSRVLQLLPESCLVSLLPSVQIFSETIDTVQGWQTVQNPGKRIPGFLPPVTIMKSCSLEAANRQRFHKTIFSLSPPGENSTWVELYMLLGKWAS